MADVTVSTVGADVDAPATDDVPAELLEAELLEADLLVEDVSIDGMCGVY